MIDLWSFLQVVFTTESSLVGWVLGTITAIILYLFTKRPWLSASAGLVSVAYFNFGLVLIVLCVATLFSQYL